MVKLSGQTREQGELTGVLLRNLIEAKAAKMSRKDAIAKNLLIEVWLALDEKDFASASLKLWRSHKDARDLWSSVKIELLRSADEHSELFIMANLISVAEKDSLSASFHLVPGLYSLSRRLNIPSFDYENH